MDKITFDLYGQLRLLERDFVAFIPAKYYVQGTNLVGKRNFDGRRLVQ